MTPFLRRLVELVAPARMGTAFRWQLSSSWVGQLGDGIALAAGPLLVASLTRNPTLIAAAAMVQNLPTSCSACMPVPSPTAWTGAVWCSSPTSSGWRCSPCSW